MLEQPPTDYASRLEHERQVFANNTNVHDLPPIFHYWSHKFLRPMLAEFGLSSPTDMFAQYFYKAAQGDSSTPAFLSIGAGNCENEIQVASMLRSRGLEDFTIECLEFNGDMLDRGATAAKDVGVDGHLVFSQDDFNRWKPLRTYQGIMASHSLHHVVNLEGLFESVAEALGPSGYFVISDMIGRNGHQRWPEAMDVIQRFWSELPPRYRYNLQLQRREEQYINWDCAQQGFEGIRAQDILPLLIDKFKFDIFIGFGNAILPFIDRGFGHHFRADGEWDCMFIDRVHAADELGFQTRTLTPCQMLAVTCVGANARNLFSRGISPAHAVRVP